jgi:hypothetical protein
MPDYILGNQDLMNAFGNDNSQAFELFKIKMKGHGERKKKAAETYKTEYKLIQDKENETMIDFVSKYPYLAIDKITVQALSIQETLQYSHLTGDDLDLALKEQLTVFKRNIAEQLLTGKIKEVDLIDYLSIKESNLLTSEEIGEVTKEG